MTALAWAALLVFVILMALTPWAFGAKPCPVCGRVKRSKCMCARWRD